MRQLQAFARKQTIAPRIIDLNPTIGGAIQMLRRLVGEDIELVWRPAGALWPVKVDPAQIDEILVNLCANARDAIAGVGRVTLATSRVLLDEAACAPWPDAAPGEYARLAVGDSGCGMPPEVQAQIFEPFYTTKPAVKGTGLGLPVSYGIVRNHGGEIRVASRPGEGSTFTVLLPVAGGGAEAAGR